MSTVRQVGGFIIVETRGHRRTNCVVLLKEAAQNAFRYKKTWLPRDRHLNPSWVNRVASIASAIWPVNVQQQKCLAFPMD